MQLTFPAGERLAPRLIPFYVSGGRVFKLSELSASQVLAFAGFLAKPSGAGGLITLPNRGDLIEGFSDLVAGACYYLGLNGPVLRENASGWSRYLGRAASSKALLYDPGPPEYFGGAGVGDTYAVKSVVFRETIQGQTEFQIPEVAELIAVPIVFIGASPLVPGDQAGETFSIQLPDLVVLDFGLPAGGIPVTIVYQG